MARTDTLANFVTDVANAIRTKSGKSDLISPSNFDTEIINLPSGETPTIGFVVNEWDDEGYPISMSFYGYTKLPAGMFYHTLPNSVTEGHMASSRLKTVTMDDTVTEIGNFAFQDNTNLVNVQMSENVTTLGTQIFYGCTNLESIALSDKITVINDYDFYGCSKLVMEKLPDSLTTIDANAFYGCTNLALTELPTGLLTIGASAFYGCTNLALTELPETMTSVGSSAFKGCTNLALTELPESVTSWGSNTFQNSGIAIKTLPSTFSKSTKSIPTYFLAGCKNITDFAFPVANTAVHSDYFQIMASAFADCTNLTMDEFPKGVYTLYDKAFFNCTSLDVPELEVYNWNGNTANWTGQYAFSNTGLTKVHLKGNSRAPSGSSVRSHMFANCLKLEEVTVTGRFEFGTNAFEGCSILKKFDIGFATNQTTRVNLKASMFKNCTSLDTVIVRYDNGVSTLSNTSAFTGTPIESGTGYIYVPDDLVETYKTATNWSTYATQIKPISELPTEEV